MVNSSQLSTQQRIKLLREKRLRETQTFQQRARLQQQRQLVQGRIDRYRQEISRIKRNLDLAARGELKGKKYKGSRARKVWNNRIKGREAAIRLLEQNIGKGFVAKDLINVAEDARTQTTRSLEKKRLKQFTPGSAKSGVITKATAGVKILSGRVSKDFTRVQTPATAKARAAKIRAIAADIAREQDTKAISNAFANSGLDIVNKVFTPKQRKEIFISLTTVSTLSEGQTKQKLREIDQNPILNDIQKEEAKRVILGIGKTAKDILITPNERLRKVLAANLRIPNSTQERIITGQSLNSTDIEKLRAVSLSNPSKAQVKAELLRTLKNAPANVAKGLAEVAYELTIGTAIGALNFGKWYGSNIGNAIREKRFADAAIGIGFGPLGIIATKRTTKKVAEFIIKNPKEAVALFGLAVAAGLSATEAEFNRNPVKTTTKAIAYLSPVRIAKAILKPINASIKKVNKLAFRADEATVIARELNQVKKLKDLKVLSNTEKKLINSEIKLLQEQLDLANDVNKIKAKLKNVLSPKSDIDKIIAGKKQVSIKDIKKANKETPKQLSEFEKAVTALDKKNRRISKKRKSTRQKLSDKRKAELLRDFTKIKKLEVTLVKKLPDNKAELQKLLLNARKTSGQAFSNLKKKIKKEKGLNVVERKKKGKVTFELLEPKEQRRKGIKTAAEKETIIDIERKQLIKKRTFKKTIDTIEDIAEPKKSLKQLDKEFKQVERDVVRMKRAGLLKGTKAQTNLIGSVRRGYTKTKRNVNKIKTELREFRQSYRKEVKKLKDINSKRIKQGKSPLRETKAKISNRQRRLNELKQRLVLEQKKEKGFIKLLLLFVRAEILTKNAIKSLTGLLEDQLKDIDNINDQLKDLVQDIEKINQQIIPKPSKPGPRKPGKPGPRITRAPPKSPKATQIKPPIVPRRPPGKPPTPPPLRPKPKLDFNFDSAKLNNRVVQFQGTYRERKFRSKPAGKNNPVVTKRINLKTTKNRALKKVSELVDKRTARSLELRVVGLTDKKQKDIQRPTTLKKFDTKKSKGTPVLKLVEKSKFAIDSKGEKRELKRSKSVKVSAKRKKSSQNRSKVSKKKK